MLRTAAWTLRQPRYRALAALMIGLAAFCVVAGTWQISRYTQKVRDNDALRANAHDPSVPLTPALLPIVGTRPAPSAEAIRFRTVTATGTYLTESQQYLDQQADSADTPGFWVLTPLRTAAGVIPVVRGFVAAQPDGRRPASVPAAPSGQVRVTGRLETANTSGDDAGRLPDGVVESINPADQARRLKLPVFDAYLTLAAGQPGAAGLTPLPGPDLSNPAGGAAEWQHMAYIVQWYLFALLALAAPFAMGVHETRDARRTYLGLDPGAEQFDALDPEELLALPGASQDSGARAAGSELALREAAEAGGLVVRRGEPSLAQWRRAARLADRYGRSLGPGTPRPDARPDGLSRRRVWRVATSGSDHRPASSASTPARAIDEYHGAYNDYLWQLALADGNIPDISLPGDTDAADTAAAAEQAPQPRVVDVPPAEDDQG